MSIPHTFAAYPAGNFPASDWDGNWSFVAALTNIFCSAGGSSNAIVLTPAATSPTVTAYQSGMTFKFVADNTNGGATTLLVGSAPALTVFTAAGVALIGGEIVAGVMYEATFDQTLVGGAGGFRIGASASSSLPGPTNIQAFGATCTGANTPDSTTAIQNAIAAVPIGGSLYIPACPSGQGYVIIGSGSTIFTRATAMTIFGDGGGSILFTTAAVPNTRDIFTFAYTGQLTAFSLHDFSILSAGGTARHAILFNATGAGLAINVTIRNLLITATGGGQSIRAVNTGSSTGLTYSQILDCNLESIFLDQVGDGITIQSNVIGASAATGNAAIRANFVAGAGGFFVNNNVLTAVGGAAINLNNGNGAVISQNYCETPVGITNTYGFLIDVNVSGGGMLSPQLINNQISVLTGTGNPIPVRIRTGTANARLADMRYLNQTGNHVQIDAGATDTTIDRATQAVTGGTVGTLTVGDSGTRTGSTLYLADGALGSGSLLSNGPSMAFLAERGTGIYRSAANTMAFSAAGNQVMTVNNPSGVTIPGGFNLTVSGGAVSFASTLAVTILSISANATAVTPASTFQIFGADGTATNFIFDTFAAQSAIIFRRANNTNASQAALAANDGIGALAWRGHDGTAYSTANSVIIRGFAAEAWDTTHHGAYMTFNTTPKASVAAATIRLFIADDGGIVFGNSTTSPGANLIQLPNLSTDSTHTDRTVCQDTTSNVLYFGSGAAGICLGTSSARFKRDIEPYSDGLSVIERLEPKQFRYLSGYVDDGARAQFGLLAEELVEIEPRFVTLDTQGQPNSVDWPNVIWTLVNAVKELSAEVEQLRKAA